MKPFRFPQFRSWPLWLTWGALIGSLVAEHFTKLSVAGHEVAEIAIMTSFVVVLGRLVSVL